MDYSIRATLAWVIITNSMILNYELKHSTCLQTQRTSFRSSNPPRLACTWRCCIRWRVESVAYHLTDRSFQEKFGSSVLGYPSMGRRSSTVEASNNYHLIPQWCILMSCCCYSTPHCSSCRLCYWRCCWNSIRHIPWLFSFVAPLLSSIRSSLRGGTMPMNYWSFTVKSS